MTATAVRLPAPLALMGLIFYLSSQEPGGLDLPEFTQILAHLIEYTLLAALWIWALAPALGRRCVVVAVAITLLYAVSDEYHQEFVAGRDSNPLDLLVDAVGIALAVSLLSARRAGEHPRRTCR